jgi:hypothetical protein
MGYSKIDKIWDFFRWDLPRFFRNVWKFRKELTQFGGWDWHHTLSMTKKCLVIQEDSMSKNSNEVPETLNLKLYYIRRSIYLIDSILEDKFTEMAEERLGLKTIFKDFVLEDVEGSDSKRIVWEEESEEEREINKKIFFESSKIEKEVWSELFDILKGDIYPIDIYTKFKDEPYEKIHNGKGLNNWWY